MTGPEHYTEAERLLAGTPKTDADRERGIGAMNEPWPPTEMELRAAQVHATLAAAAASAANTGNRYWADWYRVAYQTQTERDGAERERNGS